MIWAYILCVLATAVTLASVWRYGDKAVLRGAVLGLVGAGLWIAYALVRPDYGILAINGCFVALHGLNACRVAPRRPRRRIRVPRPRKAGKNASRVIPAYPLLPGMRAVDPDEETALTIERSRG